jgi:heterodisulfide reductase subunit A
LLFNISSLLLTDTIQRTTGDNIMPHTPTVLIIGGGIAGMSAAKTLAASGLSVYLVEKKSHLGGKALNWACMATDQCQNCGACICAELVDQTSRFQNITIHTQSIVAQITKTENKFLVRLNNDNTSLLKVDAVLVATGFELFDPVVFQSLGYKRHTNVITTAELNGALKEETLSKLLPDKLDPAIAFILCVGSRNREIGRDYCSQVCCKTSLHQAEKLFHRLPSAKISVFHIDLQIIGKEFRTKVANVKNQINLLQGVPAEILTGYKKDKLTVIREDGETGARKAHHFDLIVLAVGMGPSKETAKLMQMLKLSPDEWGFTSNHEVCKQKGIYFTGAANAPMDIMQTKEQAIGMANQIIRDFKIGTQPQKIAVLGHSSEGLLVAKTLVSDNHKVFLIDQGKSDKPLPKEVHQFSNTALSNLQGTYGDFTLNMESAQGKQSITTDAVVVATGAEKVPASSPTDMASDPNIMALSAFQLRLEKEIVAIPSEIVFWLDRDGPEWKDNWNKVLKLGQQLLDAHKSVSILMDKMLVHGLLGQRHYDRARRKGIKFLRIASGTRPIVRKIDTGLSVTINEATLPAVDLEIKCGCMVIPEKITPKADSSQISQCLNIACDQEGFLQPANVRHRLTGSPRKGVFFVGSCHDETDNTDLPLEIDGIRAALTLFKTDVSKDGDKPEIKKERCVKCLICFRICPHKAIILTSFRQPTIMPQACFNCGLCVANCPAKAIESIEILPSTPIDAPIPHTVVFACRRSGALAAANARKLGLCHQDDLQVVPIDCAGRLSMETLLQPLIKGSRRVMIAACHSGNCRSMVGPESAAAKVNRVFTEANLPTDMLSFHNLAANEPATFAKMVTRDSSHKKGDQI